MVRAANERTPLFYVAGTAWLVVAVLLTVWDLGVVAFVGSVLLAIWVFGLRDKFASEETASAYSVFNRDGKAIAGGFTAQQLDRQLRGGALGGTASNANDDDPVRGSVAAADTATPKAEAAAKMSDAERLRRRTAAAAAAERRFQQENLPSMPATTG